MSKIYECDICKTLIRNGVVYSLSAESKYPCFSEDKNMNHIITDPEYDLDSIHLDVCHSCCKKIKENIFLLAARNIK